MSHRCRGRTRLKAAGGGVRSAGLASCEWANPHLHKLRHVECSSDRNGAERQSEVMWLWVLIWLLFRLVWLSSCFHVKTSSASIGWSTSSGSSQSFLNQWLMFLGLCGVSESLLRELSESCEQVTDCSDMNTGSDAKWAVKTNAGFQPMLALKGNADLTEWKYFSYRSVLQDAAEPETIDTPSLYPCCDWWLESSMQPRWSRPSVCPFKAILVDWNRTRVPPDHPG